MYLEFISLLIITRSFSFRNSPPLLCYSHELWMDWLHSTSKVYYFIPLKTKNWSSKGPDPSAFCFFLATVTGAIGVNLKTFVKWLYKVTVSLPLGMNQVACCYWQPFSDYDGSQPGEAARALDKDIAKRITENWETALIKTSWPFQTCEPINLVYYSC